MLTAFQHNHIRLAQNYCLGSKTYDGANTPKGGWGVHFALASPSSYIIFADKNGNLAYDAGEALPAGLIALPQGMVITAISPAAASVALFKPPKPTIYINGGTVFNLVAVTVKHSLSGQMKKIILNRISGRIDVE